MCLSIDGILPLCSILKYSRWPPKWSNKSWNCSISVHVNDNVTIFVIVMIVVLKACYYVIILIIIVHKLICTMLQNIQDGCQLGLKNLIIIAYYIMFLYKKEIMMVGMGIYLDHSKYMQLFLQSPVY